MVVPSHVYVNLNVVSNDLTSDIGAPALKFQETRTSPYIEGDSADYLCSTIRFSIQTGSSLPAFIPRIELRQEDVNKTVYAITLKVLSVDDGVVRLFTQPIQFTKVDNTAPTPAPPLVAQDLSSTYYYVYNFISVINMLNENLQIAITELAKLFTNASDRNYFSFQKLFFEMDPDSYKISFNIEDGFTYHANIQTGNTFKGEIYLNTRLYELLYGLPCRRMNRSGSLNYLVEWDPYSVRQRKVQYSDIKNIYQAVQETSSIPMWNPIASIVFSTGLLPIFATNNSPHPPTACMLKATSLAAETTQT